LTEDDRRQTAKSGRPSVVGGQWMPVLRNSCVTFVVDFDADFCYHLPNKKEWKYVSQTAKESMELKGR
jgi:hypothetical protein